MSFGNEKEDVMGGDQEEEAVGVINNEKEENIGVDINGEEDWGVTNSQ